MANNSMTYCDSDEECFFGKVSNREFVKRAVLGMNADSPASTCGTPRPKTQNYLSKIRKLPDVIDGPASTSKTLFSEQEVIPASDKDEKPSDIQSANSSINESDHDIIILDSQDDSVQTISDDESFKENEIKTGHHTESNLEDSSVQSNYHEASNSPHWEAKNILYSSSSNQLKNNEILESDTFPGQELYPVEDVKANNMLIDESSSGDQFFTSLNSGTDIQECNLESQIETESTKPVSNKDEKGDIIGNFQDISVSGSGDITTHNVYDTSKTSVQSNSKDNTDAIVNSIDFSNNIALSKQNCPVKDCQGAIDLLESNIMKSSSQEVKPHVTTNFKSYSDDQNKNTEFAEIGDDNIFVCQDKISNNIVTTNLESTSITFAQEVIDLSNNQVLSDENTDRKKAEETAILENYSMALSEQQMIPIEEQTNKSNHNNSTIHEHEFKSTNSKTDITSIITISDQDDSNKNISYLNDANIDTLASSINTDHSNNHKDKENYATQYDILFADKATIDNFDYSLLDGVTDSILNISHGSSLPSPPLLYEQRSFECKDSTTSCKDIISDKKSLLNSDLEHFNNLSKPLEKIDDLHMSVDECDFQKNLAHDFSASLNSSQPSNYQSCLPMSNDSSYHTAPTMNIGNMSSSDLASNSFQKYRECNSPDIVEKYENFQEFLEETNEEKNEADFEIITQKRQNSFTTSPSPVIGSNKKANEQAKPTASKLPVLQSLLKPPKLYVKPDTLKTTNYKWAKNLPKSCSGKNDPNLNLAKKESSKCLNSKLKIPSSDPKTITMTQTKTLTENKTPNAKFLYRSKTPSEKKTPAKSVLGQSAKLTKSDTKNYTNTKASYSFTSSDKNKNNKNSPLPLQEKNRYQHIKSPIQAYITGSPVVLQKKTVPEIQISKTKIPTHIPVKKHTPLKPPKAVQKLQYENSQGQENVDPNNTLPPKRPETASAVFIVQPEDQKKGVPKVGESMQKLLNSTPKTKLTVHQGRAMKTPQTKGILIANTDDASSLSQANESPGRISVRIVKSPQKNPDFFK